MIETLEPARTITVDAAVDEYIHLISRTRPWTKAEEEEFLLGWSDWLYERFGPDVPLARAGPAVLLAFGEERGVTPERIEEFARIVSNVWVVALGR